MAMERDLPRAHAHSARRETWHTSGTSEIAAAAHKARRSTSALLRTAACRWLSPVRRRIAARFYRERCVKTSLMFSVLVSIAGCTRTEHPSSRSRAECKQRCSEYKSENEGGWSGFVKSATEDKSKYRRCMEICRHRDE